MDIGGPSAENLNVQYRVNVQVFVDVLDPVAVRRAAWNMVAASDDDGPVEEDEFADEATKTMAHSLSVIFGGIRVSEALVGAVHPIPALLMTGTYVQPDWVEPLS